MQGGPFLPVDARYWLSHDPLGPYVCAPQYLYTPYIRHEREVVRIKNNVDVRSLSSQVLPCLPPWVQPTPVRQDLRHLCVFSVDDPRCRVIDDALHCRILQNGNFEVGVHIADVANFVQPGTTLDNKAARKGTSVPVGERRIDMFPKYLSQDIWSLRANVERLAFSVIWEMTPKAEFISTRYTKSVVKSCAALSYHEAQERMDDSKLVDPLTTNLRNLNDLAKIMRQRRIDRGSLMLTCETHDPIDETHEVNHMVEEFMLAANVSVAEKILRHFPSCSLLRRQPTPTKEMLEPLLRIAAVAGLSLDVTSSKALIQSLESAMGEDLSFNKLIRTTAMRCMTPAMYFCSGDLNPSEFHHYSLGVPVFTHFTSPNRRYADVIVHRLLAASLGITKLTDALQDQSQLSKIAADLNNRHRNVQLKSGGIWQ